MEHGWQGNYYQTVIQGKKADLKPLIGAEAYWVKDRFEKDRSNCHIYIGAKNENGRQALNDILSEASISGFYGQARIDVPLILSLPANDVWVTSACVAYWKYDDIDSITQQFFEHFKQNFFLEVQYHNTESQKNINKHIIELHNTLKIPIIMGCDSHYININQAQNRTDFLISKGLNYPDEEGWYLDYPDGDTAYNRFAEQCILTDSEIREAIDNTNTFLDVEEYDNPIFDDSIKMPSLYPDWTQNERNDEYKRLVWAGWDNYKANIPENEHKKYEEEIEKEIKVVVDTGMADYFITNAHVIKKGKENGGNLTKGGRGSGVSFFTNMLLGFTEVDRIAAKIKMYPERFMSATRILESKSLPDIDFNCANVEPFALAQKEILGEDHAYPMISYGTSQTSAAWKLYAKSQNIPFDVANEVSQQIQRYENAVKHAPEDERSDIDVLDYIDKQYQEVFKGSNDYLGLITSWSIAPCSYLLYQGSIRKEIGLIKIKDNLCCLMDGKWAEDGHFLKNDLLKVSVVDLIYRTYNRLGREPPNVQDLLSDCTPDNEAWTIYEKSCTLGINQCEQPGTASRVAKYKPKNISELTAFIAAIRPGFKSMYKIFEERKPFEYDIKAFDDLIQTEEMPNSFVLYQEQVMASLNYAGIDMGKCHTAIKNISKKRTELVLSYKSQFLNGFKTSAIKEGKSETDAENIIQSIWQIIEDSANYLFNASHGYCVALDSLYGSWLKAHHPLEFYETFLNILDEKGDKDRMNAVKAEAEEYFNIKFPPFKYGQDNRYIQGDSKTNTIVNSISAIKGFGSKVGDILYEISQQEYTHFIDLLMALKINGLQKNLVDTLIKIDYFSPLFGNAKELLRIRDIFDFFKDGNAKSIDKSKVNGKLEEILIKYATSVNADGTISKSYNITTPQMTEIDKQLRKLRAKLKKDAENIEIQNEIDVLTEEKDKIYAEHMYHLLIECELHIKSLNIQDFSYKEKIETQLEMLGYVDLTTNDPNDIGKLFVTDVKPLINDEKTWGYAVFTRSIASGKIGRFTIRESLYKRDPIHIKDMIFTTKDNIFKNKKGYWYMQKYNHIY